MVAVIVIPLQFDSRVVTSDFPSFAYLFGSVAYHEVNEAVTRNLDLNSVA